MIHMFCVARLFPLIAFGKPAKGTSEGTKHGLSNIGEKAGSGQMLESSIARLLARCLGSVKPISTMVLLFSLFKYTGSIAR